MAPWPGRPFPLGATPGPDGTNFAVASNVADGVSLCLFDAAGTERKMPLVEKDAGIWHGFVPGVGPGRRYGYRVSGPYRPGPGGPGSPLQPEQAAPRPLRSGHRRRGRLG